MSGVEIAVALAAISAGALLKSVSGLGLPLVAIPTISFVADVPTAVAVMAVPNLVLNLAIVWRERGHWSETRDLPVLGAAGFVGALGGTALLVSVPEAALVALLVIVVAVYVVVFLTAPEFSISPKRSRRLAPGVGLVAGGLQGAIGISGPIVGSWIHAYRLPRDAHVLSVTTMFSLASLAQVPALAASGEMAGRWSTALVACVLALATIPLGERLRRRMASTTFDRVVVALLAASVCGLALRTF